MNDLQNVEWINYREARKPAPRMEPQIDAVISRLVGRKIYQQDPRVMKLICKWKKGKDPDSMVPDNFLEDERKVKELIETLNQGL